MTAHVQKKSQEKQNNFEVLRLVWDDPRQRMALLFSGLVMMGHFMIVPFINPYMEFNNGYPKSVTPMIYLIGGGECIGMGSRPLRKIAGIYVLCVLVCNTGVCFNQCTSHSLFIYPGNVWFLVRLFNR